MVAKLRLFAAFGALFMAAVVVWQSAPPATSVGPPWNYGPPPLRWTRPPR